MAKLSYEDAIKLVGDAFDEIEKHKQEIIRLVAPEPKLATVREDFDAYLKSTNDSLLVIWRMLQESQSVYGGQEADEPKKPVAKAPAARGDKTKAAKNNGSSKATVKKSTTKAAAGAQRRQRGGAKKVTPGAKPAADKPTASDKHRVEVPE